MHQLQEADSRHHGSPGERDDLARAGWVLENPDRVTLCRGNHFIATCIGCSYFVFCDEDITCTIRKVRSLNWSHFSGLRLLQGGTLAQLLGPYVVLAFERRPVFDPQPGLDRVVLVDVVLRRTTLEGADLYAALLEKTKNVDLSF